MTQPPLAQQMPDGSRRYVHPKTGEIWPSITTVLRTMAKPEVEDWKIRMAADHANANWNEMAAWHPDQRKEAMTGAHAAYTNEKAELGTLVHEICDSWMKGSPIETPKAAVSYMNQFTKFLMERRPVFLETEVTLLSRKHEYAGTADWIAEMDGVTVLGDNKTSPKVYPEHAIQLAALAGCDRILREDGSEEPIPEISRLMVLQIRPRSWHLYEVTARVAAFQVFKAARAIWEWNDGIKDDALRQVI